MKAPLLILPALLLVAVGCDSTTEVTSPELDGESLAVLAQGAPSEAMILEAVSFCHLTSSGELWGCPQANPLKEYALMFLKVVPGQAPVPVSKGTVVWYACERDGQTVGSDYCEDKLARWKTVDKVSIGGDGWARFSFYGPPAGVVYGFKWKYLAQGSGIKSQAGQPYPFIGEI